MGGERARRRLRLRRRPKVWLRLGSPLVFGFIGLAACNGEGMGEADRADPIDALVADLLPRLEELSGLTAVEPIRVERRSREALRDYLARQLEREFPPEELEGIAGAYSLLGLLPDTLDLRGLLLELYTEQVLGYYDPETEALYLVEGAAPEALQPILAHEMVHALQDQHAPLDSLIAPERGNDRQLAAQAALEGHATLVMLRLMLEDRLGQTIPAEQLPDLAGQLGAGTAAYGEQFPVFAAAPAIIRETLIYPYTEGASFVQALWRAHPGVAPLDTLLPVSTEQVSDPTARFLNRRDAPTEVQFEPLPSDAGHVVYQNTLGQFELSIFLREQGGEAAAAAAEGWDGDRFILVRRNDSDVLIWTTVWDGADAAARFGHAATEILRDWPGRHGDVRRQDVGGRAAVTIRLSDEPIGGSGPDARARLIAPS